MKFLKQRDKQQHIIISFYMTLILMLFIPMWLAITLTFLVGVSKEVYDKVSGKGSPELLDIVANTIGITLAVIIIGLLL